MKKFTLPQETKIKKIIPNLITFLLFVIFAIIVVISRKPTFVNLPVYHLSISNSENFLHAVNEVYPVLDIQPVSGIVPHHALASDKIANFFSVLKNSTFNTIVILGPNHTEAGDSSFQTSNYIWQTEYGLVMPNKKIITTLIDNEGVVLSNDIVVDDQSISTLIPFLAHYLPEVKVVPLLLKRSISETQLQHLASALTKLPKTMVIASVDFSHYLTSIEAENNDNITLSTIRNRDYRALLSMNSDYLDSPASVVTLLIYSDNLGAGDDIVLSSGTSGDYGNPFAPGTSYLSLLFKRK